MGGWTCTPARKSSNSLSECTLPVSPSSAPIHRQVQAEGKPDKQQENGGMTLLPAGAQLETRSQQHPQMPKSNSKADIHNLPP